MQKWRQQIIPFIAQKEKPTERPIKKSSGETSLLCFEQTAEVNYLKQLDVFEADLQSNSSKDVGEQQNPSPLKVVLCLTLS